MCGLVVRISDLLSVILQILNILLSNIFDDFGIWWLGYRSEFSCLYTMYSTRALYHKYFVAMKYRWVCIFSYLLKKQKTFKCNIEHPSLK